VALAVGEPLEVPGDSSEQQLETARAELDVRLKSLERQARALLG
jgi:hypothetical protein